MGFWTSTERARDDGRRHEEERLHTVVGELRLNQTALQLQVTDAIARLVRLESMSVTETLAMQTFSQHVQSCEKSNDARSVSQKSFRREMRGYAFAALGIIFTGLGFLLYHGLPYTIRG